MKLKTQNKQYAGFDSSSTYINFLLQMSLQSGKIANMKLSRLHWKTIWIAIIIIYHSESESVSCLLCLTLCTTMDRSLPGSSVHEIVQVKILEWVDIPSSKGSAWSRDRIWVSCIADVFFPLWTTSEASLRGKFSINYDTIIFEFTGIFSK